MNRLRAIVIVIVVGLLLRLAVALYLGDVVEPLPGISDQVSYDALAQRVLAGHGFSFAKDWYPFIAANEPTAHWSYLYTLYLAAVYAVFGHHPLAARIIQVLASGLTFWLLWRLGKRLFGETVGIAAALLAALYGYFIVFNAALMTQTFYTVAVLGALDLATALTVQPSRRRWVGLGLVLGVGALLRQNLVLFTPLLFAWLVWSLWSRLRVRDVLLAAGLAGLVIVPWTLYNYGVFGDFLLLNSNGGFFLYSANHPNQGTHFDPNYVAPLPPDLRGLSEPAVDRALYRRAIGFIVADPLRFLRLTFDRVPHYFWLGPSSQSSWISNLVRSFSFTLYAPLMLWGLIVARARWTAFLPLILYVAFDDALHLISWAAPRYRLPSDAVMMTFAGVALVDLARRCGWQQTTRSTFRAASIAAEARVCIVVVSWNTRDLLERCLRSIGATTPSSEIEVIVVDNASTDGTAEMVREQFPRVRLVINDDNAGFAYANNQAVQLTDAPYVLLLNSDARLQTGTVAQLRATAAAHPSAAAVGARLIFEDGRFQASYQDFPNLMREALVLSGAGRLLFGAPYPSHGPELERGAQPVDWVSGACVLLRRDAFAAVRGFDERYFMYGEDMDLCYRLRQAGWEIWYEPAAVAVHVGSASSDRRSTRREILLYQGRVRFFRDHYGVAAARRLVAVLYAFTWTKRIAHSVLRLLSGGRRGRPVVSLTALRAGLRDSQAASRARAPQRLVAAQPARRLKILLLTQVLPYPPDSGPKVKTLNVIQALAAKHEISLASFRRGDQTAAAKSLEQWCSAVYTVPIRRFAAAEIFYAGASVLTATPFIMRRDRRAAMHRLVRELTAAQQFDVVHADQLNMAQYALPVSGAYRILDAHNALWLLYRRLWATLPPGPRKWILGREWPLLKRYEGEMCRAFDAVLSVSQEDAGALDEAAGKRLARHVIPISVDTAAHSPLRRPSSPNHVLHLGTMYWPPNIDAVQWFVNEVWPRIRAARPQAVLDIVGAQPPRVITRLHNAGGINVAGYVADATPYLEQAGAFVVPLRVGSGVRVKILIALAHGVPVVTTRLGCEGLAVTDGHDVLIADSAEEFAAAVVRLLADGELATRLGVNGRRLVESRYDVAVVAGLVHEVYAAAARGPVDRIAVDRRTATGVVVDTS